MRGSAGLLATLRHAANAATIQLPEQLRSSQAWAALPALSALVQAPQASCVFGRTASRSSSPQPWQSWSPAAAVASAPIGNRGFAARPTRNKRVQAALERHKRTPQHRAAPATDDAEPVPITSAEAGSEVVPSEAPPSAVEIAQVVDHPALIITRNIEWGTVILGFEQCNKYTILNEKGETVALLAEDGGGMGTAVGRQVLRRRRPFTATILSPDGSHVICRVRRPFYFINSSIMIEDGTGAVVGEVHQRWHLWRRKYGLYLGKRQFAAIDGGLLAWEFVLRDETGGTLALIDRNFQGFGKELFTDAGKYVIHFGESPAAAAEHTANTIAAAHPDKPRPQITGLATARNELAVIPTSTGDQLDVVRGLGITERTAVLAAAVSIDFDYFSQHSQGSGMMPFLMPMPFPAYPAGDGDGEAGDAAGAGSDGAGGAAGGSGAAAEGAAGAGAGGAVGGAAGAEAGGAASSDPTGGGSDGGGWFGGGDSGGGGIFGGSDGGAGGADGSGQDLGGDDFGGDDFGGDDFGGDDVSEGGVGSILGNIWDSMTDSN